MSFFYGKSFSCLFNTEANKKTASVPTANDAMCSTVSVVAALSVLYLTSALLVLVKFFDPFLLSRTKKKKQKNFTGPSGDFHRRECSRLNYRQEKRTENIDFIPLAGINLTPPTCTSRSVYCAYRYDFFRQSNSSF